MKSSNRNSEPLVMKLKNRLYGLKQAPQIWNAPFDKTLKPSGVNLPISDYCAYIRESRKSSVMVTPEFEKGQMTK